MANTLDIMISCCGYESEAIENFNKYANIDLRLVTDPTLCGGSKVVIFESYATCVRCEVIEDVHYLLDCFNEAPWEYPHLVTLLIDDDNDRISGVYTVKAD